MPLNATTFYYVVFPCNGSPIFNSNHIPSLDTPPYFPGDPVYVGPMEEVAQQKLQELAFASAFGGKKGVTPREGPPWTARVESVPGKNGALRRQIIITSTFAVLFDSGGSELRTMQERYLAVALVIRCPPDEPRFQFLLENFDRVVRPMLHITLDFGVWGSRYYFERLGRNTSKEWVGELERHPAARKTQCALGDILANTFARRHTFPRMYNWKSEVTITSPSCAALEQTHGATHSVECLVYDALFGVWKFSPDFASRLVAGFLSLSNWKECGLLSNGVKSGGKQSNEEDVEDLFDDENDVYSEYWKSMDSNRGNTDTRVLFESGQCTTVNQHNNHNDSDDKTEGTALAVRSSWKESWGSALTGDTTDRGVSTTSCLLSLHRVGRVVIFCTDPDLAQCLLILAAFFFRDRRVSTTAPGHLCDESPFAGKVDSCANPSSLPVQWVREDYDPNRVNHLIFSPHSVDNTVLIIAPHANMLCRRWQIAKTFSFCPVLVDKSHNSHRQPVQLFRQRLLHDTEMRQDQTIFMALQEALRLPKKSDGAMSCAAFLDFFCGWFVRRCSVARLQKKRQAGGEGEKCPAFVPSVPCGEDAAPTCFSSVSQKEKSESFFHMPHRFADWLRSFTGPTASMGRHVQAVSDIIQCDAFESASSSSQLMQLLIDD